MRREGIDVQHYHMKVHICEGAKFRYLRVLLADISQEVVDEFGHQPARMVDASNQLRNHLTHREREREH